MNLKAKYKALLLTTVLVGFFVLALINLTLSASIYQKEVLYELSMEDSDLIEDILKEIEEMPSEESQIETHKAFNESEKLAENIPDNSQTTEATKGKKTDPSKRSYDEKLLDELEKERELLLSTTGTEIITSNNNSAGSKSSKKANSKKLEKSNVDNHSKDIAMVTSANRNSSNYYNLVGRKIEVFPNPVYTCGRSGKIVINIIVNNYGKVVKTAFNPAASTSTNQCLIDNAIEYASEAVFNISDSKVDQIGTITYIFPGQGLN